MPVHDWTRVAAGIFHHFHFNWIAEIARRLNGGILPDGYYAMAEQVVGPLGPDTLVLHGSRRNNPEPLPEPPGAISVAQSPPHVRIAATAEVDRLAKRKNRIVIHHVSDHRIIALIEVVSPGNKSSRRAFHRFIRKVAAALAHGCNFLVIDLFPPTPRDPEGIHNAIWEMVANETSVLPPDKPLTLASYTGGVVKAYVEPVAVGDPLIAMPLFLDPDFYVLVPLEDAYQAAWMTMPPFWRTVLESVETNE